MDFSSGGSEFEIDSFLCSLMKGGLFILLILGLHGGLSAQTLLAGRVLGSDGQEVLVGINITNFTQGKFTRSNSDGRYEIPAAAGDRVVFSSAGYRPDTVIVRNFDLMDEHDVYLRANIVELEDVTVDQMSKYIQDSIRRKNDYADLLGKKKSVRLVNNKQTGDAPGFNFSPIGYNSKKESQKRRLIKRLEDQDRDEYIDIKFSRQKVAFLTKFTGDTLITFMKDYRPSYDFCRQANTSDMLLYINDKFIAFKKRKNM